MSKRFGPMLCLLLFAWAGIARPQVPGSAFEGSWRGMLTTISTETCTGGFSSKTTCTEAESWFGSVDPSGDFSVTFGKGAKTCSDGTVDQGIPARGPYSYGQVRANGIDSIPEYRSSETAPDWFGTDSYSTWCPAWSLQFSPNGVDGTTSCIFTADIANYFRCGTESTQHWTASRVLPIFPIAVDSNIELHSTTVTAHIQPRSQDVGTTASTFVFAHVPASVLTRGSNFRDVCVLAQLDSNGKLVEASPSSLRPDSTGMLSSEVRSISIVPAVANDNLWGATFLVGYGATSSAMFANGTYQGAATFGSSPCTATQLGGAAPDSPGALSGLWWNAGEPGWGISITQRRDIVFAAWYTYDASGNPKWYVASDCTMTTTGVNGTCGGTLYEANGPVFFGTDFKASLVNVLPIGNLQVTFRDASKATMTYTLGTQTRTVAITRQVFATGQTPPAVDYTDLWWNPNEPGWGMAMSHQHGTIFLTWYVYDSLGKPTWYIASDCVVRQSACFGKVYRTTGPALGATFDPSAVTVLPVGDIVAVFGDANNAALTYSIDGVVATKLINRQRF
jgi:hypothetical protein